MYVPLLHAYVLVYSVAWQTEFQSLLSFEVGDQGGHKVVRVGRPATENIIVVSQQPWERSI